MVEIFGENFSTFLTVWFDDVACETYYRCEELMLCKPPKIGRINKNDDPICRQRKEVRILLVRHDGLVYNTGKTYVYEVDHMLMLRETYLQQRGPAIGSATHLTLGHPSPSSM
jgi:hypothetical protein